MTYRYISIGRLRRGDRCRIEVDVEIDYHIADDTYVFGSEGRLTLDHERLARVSEETYQRIKERENNASS